MSSWIVILMIWSGVEILRLLKEDRIEASRNG